MIGTTLDGKYLIQALIGRGAMGEVYQAEHAHTGRRVAVKVISSPEFIRDPSVVARFQREARAAGAIDTQHITQVLDAGVDQQSALPYLVMEFLTGEDLQHVLKRLGPLAPEVALRVVAHGCLGLQKAHEARVVHRDVKPANLFLAERDAGEIIVKLLDFGIAKVKMDQAHDTEGAGLTKTGSMLGSPLYMSPEQARGDVKHIDPRTDLWSLGVVLYEALCGRTPYHHATALGELIIAICHEWPKHIQEMAPWVSPEVAAIVHRCLRHNPDERYQSAQEMFQAVRALLPHGWAVNEEMLIPLSETRRAQVASRLELDSSRDNARTVAAAQTTAAVTQPATVPLPPPPAGRSTVMLGAGIAMLLGATAIGTYAFTRPRPHPASTPASSTTTTTTTTTTIAAVAITAATAPAVTPVATAEVRDTAIHRVRVVILPPDAQVEVEGKPATASKGLLQIEGRLGSEHNVRIRKGKLEKTEVVAITLNGANPPKIELTLTAPKPPPPAAKPPPFQ